MVKCRRPVDIVHRRRILVIPAAKAFYPQPLLQMGVATVVYRQLNMPGAVAVASMKFEAVILPLNSQSLFGARWAVMIS